MRSSTSMRPTVFIITKSGRRQPNGRGDQNKSYNSCCSCGALPCQHVELWEHSLQCILRSLVVGCCCWLYARIACRETNVSCAASQQPVASLEPRHNEPNSPGRTLASSSSSLYSPKEHSVTNSELDSRAGQHGSKKATLIVASEEKIEYT